MSLADELLGIVQGDEETGDPPVFRLGVIPAEYSGIGDPPVIFDGETVASSKTYKYLARYVPAAGDHVLLGRVRNGYVIIDKLAGGR